MVDCPTLGIRAAQARAWINALLLCAAGLSLRTVVASNALRPAADQRVSLGMSWPTLAYSNAVLVDAVGVSPTR